MDPLKNSKLKKEEKRKQISLENNDLADLHRIEQEQKMVKDLLPGYKVCSTPSLFDACIQTDFPMDDKDTTTLVSSSSGIISGVISIRSSEEDLPTAIDDAYLMPDFIGIKFSQKVQVLLKDTKKTTTVTLNLDNMDTDEIVLKVSEWPIGDMHLSVGGYEIFPQRAPDLPYYISVMTEHRKFSLEEAMLFGVDPQHAERERVAWRQKERRERRKLTDATNPATVRKTEKNYATKKKSVQVQTLIKINPNIATNEPTDILKQVSKSQEKIENNLEVIPEMLATSTSKQTHLTEAHIGPDKSSENVSEIGNQSITDDFEKDSFLNFDLVKLEDIIKSIDLEIKKHSSTEDQDQQTFKIKPETIEAMDSIKHFLTTRLPATEQREILKNDTFKTSEYLPITFTRDPTNDKEIFQANEKNISPTSGTVSDDASTTKFQNEIDAHDGSKPSIVSSVSPDKSSLVSNGERGVSQLEDSKTNSVLGIYSGHLSKASLLEQEVTEIKQLGSNKDSQASDLTHPSETSPGTSSESNEGTFHSLDPSKHLIASSLSPVTSSQQYQSYAGPGKTPLIHSSPVASSQKLQSEPGKLQSFKHSSSTPLSGTRLQQLENEKVASKDANFQNSGKTKGSSLILDSSKSLTSTAPPVITSSQQPRNLSDTLHKFDSDKSVLELTAIKNSEQIQNKEGAFQPFDLSMPLIATSLTQETDSSCKDEISSGITSGPSSVISSQQLQSKVGRVSEPDSCVHLSSLQSPASIQQHLDNRSNSLHTIESGENSPEASPVTGQPHSKAKEIHPSDFSSSSFLPCPCPVSRPSSETEQSKPEESNSFEIPKRTSVKFHSVPEVFPSLSSQPSDTHSSPTFEQSEPYLTSNLSPVSSRQFQNVADPNPVNEPAKFSLLSVPPPLSRYYPRRDDVRSELLCRCSAGLCIGELRPVGTLCRAKLQDFTTPLAEVHRELARPYPSPQSAQRLHHHDSPNREPRSDKILPPMTADPEDFLQDKQGPSSSKK